MVCSESPKRLIADGRHSSHHNMAAPGRDRSSDTMFARLENNENVVVKQEMSKQQPTRTVGVLTVLHVSKRRWRTIVRINSD